MEGSNHKVGLKLHSAPACVSSAVFACPCTGSDSLQDECFFHFLKTYLKMYYSGLSAHHIFNPCVCPVVQCRFTFCLYITVL